MTRLCCNSLISCRPFRYAASPQAEARIPGFQSEGKEESWVSGHCIVRF